MADPLRVMTYNIHHARGTDGRVSVERIGDVIARHRPDVVALQEVDVGTRRSGGVDQPAVLGRRLGMHVAFGRTMDRDGGEYGNALLSRMPIVNVREEQLPGPAMEPLVEPRGALRATVEAADGPLQVVDTHLGLGRLERGTQMAALLEWAGPRTVVCGDLNCTGLSGPMRTAGRVMRDAQRAVGPLWTRPTWPSRFPLLRIDHVLVSADLSVTSAQVPRDRLTRLASDHLPVLVTLRGRG